MIDFWKMMGFLVTNDNFRADLFSIPLRTYTMMANQRARIPGDPAASPASGGNDYALIRGLVQPYLTGMPLSLMALGEMLVSLTHQDFRADATNVARLIGGLGLSAPDDDNFYIALGAMILDSNLTPKLLAGDWEPWGFGAVTANDRDRLNRILNPAVSPAIPNAVHDFCVNLWGHECNDNLIEWPAHTHPVAI
jgi:hypothetical protein